MNSNLVTYTDLSPNHSGARTHNIDTITPHCVVGQLTKSGICQCFKSKARGASCNYGIGKNGQIALCVDEGNRSWCSSSNANDQRAVTIECASEKSAPYAMNDEVYESLLDLATDICKRNHKTKLLWIPDKHKALSYNPAEDEMLITVHRWFANKSCPGDWLYSRLDKVACEVTNRLGTSELYRVRKNWGDTKSQIGAFHSLDNARALAGKHPGYSVFNHEGEEVYPRPQSSEVQVKVKDLNIRRGPGTNYSSTGYIPIGVYTIIETSQGQGAKRWGRLKSGAGWIALDYTTEL